MATAYTAADRWLESMLTWQPTNTSATTDQQKSDQDTMVARSRDSWRNQMLGQAVVGRLDTNVIGAGLVAKPKIPGKKELSKTIQDKFEKWCKHCEYEDDVNFYSFQSLVFSSWLVAGDVFINTVVDGKDELRLQAIEAERVSNSNLAPDTKERIQGVYLPNGKPSAYSVQSTHPGDVRPEYTWKTFSKYGSETGRQRFFHLWRKIRPGQVRGVPILTPVLESFRKVDRYIDATLVDAVVTSLFSAFVKTDGGMGLPGYTDSTQEAAQNETKQDRIFLKPGMVVNLQPGEDVSFGDPGRPNPNFEAFVNAIIKMIAACIGIPFDVLMMQYNSSYSASRAALQQFWKTVLKYRWEFIEKFCQPIYELWLENEVVSGRLDLDLSVEENYNCVWVGPTKGSIDDTKEVIAARERINLGVSDIETEAEEISGRDWMEINEQRTLEHDIRKKSDLEKENSPVQTPLTMEGKEGAKNELEE